MFGLRIDLPAVEEALTAHGCTGWVAQGRESAPVGTPAIPPSPHRWSAPPPAAPGRHPGAAPADVPRTDAGKPDYPALAAGFAEPAGGGVADLFARVFGRPVAVGDSFLSLGGDSLSYVATAAGLQQLLGEVPKDWPVRTVGELSRPPAHAAAMSAATSTPAPGRTLRAAALETPLVLRALAILLVVGSHLGAYDIRGGAHVLMVLAGYSYARFSLDAPDRTRRSLRSLGRIMLPASSGSAGSCCCPMRTARACSSA